MGQLILQILFKAASIFSNILFSCCHIMNAPRIIQSMSQVLIYVLIAVAQVITMTITQ